MSSAQARIPGMTRLTATATAAVGATATATATAAAAVAATAPATAAATGPARGHSVRVPAGGLTLRSALTAFGAVAALAMALALGDVRAAAEAGREATADRAAHHLAMVQDSAAEAAYQLNAELARHVVGGLLRDETVLAASLADNFGQTLAASRRADDGGLRSELPLFYPRPDGTADRVGTLTLEIASPRRDVAPALGGLARLLACCALGGLLLHVLLRRGPR